MTKCFCYERCIVFNKKIIKCLTIVQYICTGLLKNWKETGYSYMFKVTLIYAVLDKM